METSPEIKEFCERLRNQHGIVRAVDATAYRRFIEEALEFKGCYYAFWKWSGISFLSCYRKDRRPTQAEFLPIAQELFEDGQIHKVGETKFSVEMAQGESLYITDSISNKMGSALADYADKKDEVEQFDVEQTTLGQRMKRRRNGSN